MKRGINLERAVAGIDAIVHAASDARHPLRSRALRSRGDIKGTRNLVKAAKQARIRHLVYISIVGIDGVPSSRDSVPRFDGDPAARLLAHAGNDGHAIRLEVPARRCERGRCPPRRDVLGDPQGTLEDFGGLEVRDFKSIAASGSRLARKTEGSSICQCPSNSANSSRTAS